jgi:hypothetical protein
LAVSVGPFTIAQWHEKSSSDSQSSIDGYIARRNGSMDYLVVLKEGESVTAGQSITVPW